MARISVDRRDAVINLTLTRPEKRNALDQEMLDALHAFCNEPVQDHERVVVVKAQGPSFCAGIDLAERQKTGVLTGESPVVRVFHAIEAHPLPFVAVVHGPAIAGGCELALHCDLVVAADDAPFGMSLAQIGLAPTWALAQKLLEVAGPVLTREILLLGNPVPAHRLAAQGVINRSVPLQDLAAAADEIVTRLANNAPLSLKAIKALIQREMAFRNNIAHDDVDALVNAARASADAREGITAKLEKRAPQFSGH